MKTEKGEYPFNYDLMSDETYSLMRVFRFYFIDVIHLAIVQLQRHLVKVVKALVAVYEAAQQEIVHKPFKIEINSNR